MHRTKLVVINPKRATETDSTESFWYNYYAGYSHSFTKGIIESASLKKDAIILDPWNGAGTTTYLSSLLGFSSIGIDLNPVMKIVAKAKLASQIDLENIETKLDLLNFSGRATSVLGDPLSIWFDDDSVGLIRKLEKKIYNNPLINSTREKVDSLSIEQCLLYTIIFNLLREYLIDFIPSNPTWIKGTKEISQKVSLNVIEFKQKFKIAARRMIENVRLSNRLPNSIKMQLIIGTSKSLPVESESIDLVLTSPPYCTRIDYGVATQPELALISIGGSQEIDQIRRSLMGTTTVPKILQDHPGNLGCECLNFLRSVRTHSSKASSTYYYKNLAQYFFSLDDSIREISRVMKTRSYFVCVVQDSYYKNIHCDLPTIVTQMAVESNLELIEKSSFLSRQNMANMNKKSKAYRKKTNATEVVLIFRKRE